MTKVKKIIVALLVSCMLLLPMAVTASATDLVDPDNINGIAKYFGIDLSDPESIQNAIDEIKNGGLNGILGLLGIDIADILITLEAYLAMTESSTSVLQETTTEEKTTEATTEQSSESVPVQTPSNPSYIQPEYTPPEKSDSPAVIPTKPSVSSKKPSVEATNEETTTDIELSEEFTEDFTEELSEELAFTSTNNNSSFSSQTIIIIALTLAVFISGIGTGIFIVKKLNEKRSIVDE